MIDDFDQGLGARDVFVEDASAALIKNGAFGRLKYGVVCRVAFVELALDFSLQVVLFVFGFPIAVREFVVVDQCAVNDHRRFRALYAVFRNECEFGIGPFSARSEQTLKGTTDGAFVVDVELAELVEGAVVVLDGGVRRLERDRHALEGKR